MPAAAHAKFSRADFSVAVDDKIRREKDWRLTTFFIAWVFGTGMIAVRLSSFLEKEQGWVQGAATMGMLLFVFGPAFALVLYAQRPNRTFSKCPSCRRDAIKGSNAACILATGKCGWCGYEVLERKACLQPAITAMPPSIDFKRLSPADFITTSRTARRRDAWRIFAFALLYPAGLAPFLWTFYSAAEHSTPAPGRPYVALFVAWLFLSPVLWLKLLRWLFGSDPFPSCPHCHASWRYPWESMAVIATGRCGDCGVQVLEEGGDASSTRLSGSHDNISCSVEQNPPSGEVQLLSRTRFMALCCKEKDAWEEARPKNQKRAMFFLGSSLAVLVGSILFLRGSATLLVPLGWYFAAMFIEGAFDRKHQKPPTKNSSGPDATLKKCPFCENNNQGSSRGLVIATGRCKKCRNVILQDDLGQEQKVAD